MDRWLGKTAVVTGAGSGIGEAITRALLRNEVNVAALDIQKNDDERVHRSRRRRHTVSRLDVPASPETEQLLADHTRHNTLNPCMRLQSGEWCQGDVSSSRLTPQDKFPRLDRNTEIGETSSDPAAVITSPSIIVSGNQENDDPPPYTAVPPPYSAVTPPNHVGWPYGLFSFSDLYSPDKGTCRVEIPLTPFQASLPATAFHPEEADGQHASLPPPLTPYRFFKFGSYMPRAASLSDNEIAEKVDDTKSRRYGAIFAAAAVIIFLMALSLMVRLVMERTWWRK